MSVSDGSFEKERQIELGNLNPEALEVPRQRFGIVDNGVQLLDNVVEVIINDQKAT